MKRNGLFIFLVLAIVLGCGQVPPGQSTTKTGSGMGVPLPPSEDYGVNCFVEFGDSIIAGAPSFHTYRSQNGGLTWDEPTDRTLLSGSDCSPRKGPWDLWASPEGVVRYQFNPGINIQLSTDSGANWESILDLKTIDWRAQNTPEPDKDVIVQSGPLDAMIDHKSGNLLLAMGQAGILLRLPSGEWQWVLAGRYYHGELSPLQTSVAQLQAANLTTLAAPHLIVPDTVIKAHENYTTSLVFSPEGNTLASSGYDGGIKFFTFPQGDLRFWQQWGKDRRDSTIFGAAYSTDGKILVTCGTNVDQTLRFWDSADGKLINEFNGFQTGALDTTRYSGKQFLAIAFGYNSKQKSQIKIFRLPDSNLYSTLDSQGSYISSLHFVPKSSLLAAGSFSGGVELWDIETGEKVFTFQPDQQSDDRIPAYQRVYSLGFHPDKKVVMAVFGDGSLKAWKVSNGEPAWSLSLPSPHGWYVSSAAFSPDGRMVVLGMPTGPLMLFDSFTGRTISQQWVSENGTLMELRFSPDSQWLAAGFASGEVKIWQVDRLVN